MSELRASPDSSPRRPGAAAYVLISDAKLPLFSLTAKKIQEIFNKYLISLILNELQGGIFWGFRGKTF